MDPRGAIPRVRPPSGARASLCFHRSGLQGVTHLSSLPGGPGPNLLRDMGLSGRWALGEWEEGSGGPQEIGHKLPLVQLLAKGGPPSPAGPF